MKTYTIRNLNAICCLLLLLTYTATHAQPVIEIYADPKGKIGAKGTINDPINSISAALSLARSKSSKSVQNIKIILRKGIYLIDSTVEVVQGKTWNTSIPLSIEAYKKEEVILHGGRIISAALIKPVTDEEFGNRFIPEVRKKIRQVNLSDAGIRDLGKLRPVGFGRPYGPAWMEIFINGLPGKIARWPNNGTVPIHSVIDTGSIPRRGDTINRGGVFTYAETDRPSRWKEPQKAWISGFFMWGYAADAVPLKNIDTLNKTISTQIPTMYGYGSGKPWRAWYAYNLPEEIDMPGEYYVDEIKKVLYFLPPDKLEKLEVSVLEAPLMALEGVSSVTLKNLHFTCSRGMGISMENTQGVRITGCTLNNLGMMAIFMGRGIEPQPDISRPVTGKTVSRIVGSLVGHQYNQSTYDRLAGKNNGIENCKIYNTGAGGIYFSGGNRITLEPGNSYVKNCSIHDFNRIEKTNCPAVWVTGVGNRISNCEIYNAPSLGILLHGNNHVIEYNELYNLALETDDMGAVYYGRDPSELGNIVRYNYFHHIGSGHKTMGVYHDDGACGMQVYSNIFYKAGTVPGFIGGGSDNSYTNNIFIDTKYAAHIDDRLRGWAKALLEKDGLYQQRLEAVNYKNPPYSVQYPQLPSYFEDDPAAPKRNPFSGNLLVNVDTPVQGHASWLPYLPDNYETKTDPGFMNYSKGDFRLKKNSEVWKKIPAFKAIPVEKIGLLSNKR